MISEGSLKEANLTVFRQEKQEWDVLPLLLKAQRRAWKCVCCLIYYFSLGLLIALPRLAFWSGVFSTPSSLWNTVITQSHANQHLLSQNSVWKWRWILRKKQCHCGLKSFLWSLHSHIFTSAASLNELQSKCFIYSSSAGRTCPGQFIHRWMYYSQVSSDHTKFAL